MAQTANSKESTDGLLRIMNTLRQTKCDTKKLEVLKCASKSVCSMSCEVICSSMQLTTLSPLFKDSVQLAIPAPFPDRGHFIFEKDDFLCMTERTEVVLEFLHSVLEMCNQSGVSDPKPVHECLPMLLVVLSSNIRNSLWFKDSIQNLTLRVLNQLRILYKVDSLSDLLQLDLKSKDRETATPGSCLLGEYLNTIKVRLTSKTWEANPIFVESFFWMLTQMMKFPHLGDHLQVVLPPALMFVDSHVTEHKVIGIQCLQHIAANVTNEQLRWYSRGEVMYTALKNQIYSRESEIIRVLHPALLTVLPIIDRNPTKPTPLTSPHQVDVILSIIITSAVTENGLVLRRLYTQFVAEFVESLGVCAVRHLSKLVELVCNYLEVFDGPKEEARLNALGILQSMLRNAWPRIPAYADRILKSVLKLIQDVASDTSTTPQSVKEKLTEEAVVCLGLLKGICPSVEQCLQAVSESRELEDIAASFRGLLSSCAE